MQAIGTFRHTIDAKSRMAMPAQFRDELGESFIIMKGPDKCLFVYDQEGYNVIAEQLARKSATSDDRNKQRKRFSGAFKPEMDKQGRFVLQQELIAHAGLQKDVVVFGCNSRIEIWDAATWDALMAEEDDADFDDIIW
ncbi:MAG: division/cell wall cluster transcriptional repressor MraZ [Ruminococcaceae bacterium]|nr:division/cell wall cluster transcriptional repressor MraZ [Oscillospiraceae bacterium]